jgi:DNA helicase HerA-like ATPase
MDTMNEHDEAVNFDNLVDMLEYIEEHPRVYCVRTAKRENFDFLCAMVMQPGFEGVTLTVEEAYEFFPNRRGMEQNAERLVFEGRHFAVNINLTFPRMVQISTDMRTQWDNIIAFRQGGPSDVTRLEEISGYKLGDLAFLEPGECYLIDQSECRRLFYAELAKYVRENNRRNRLDLDADDEIKVDTEMI